MTGFRRLIPSEVPALPDRTESRTLDPSLLAVVMHEYDAIRSEIDHSLSNQVSILSFGAATVGLLVAAAGTLWQDAAVLSALLLMFVVPGAGFLTLAVHAGELVRLMRAGYFLYRLERWVNRSAESTPAKLLIWEHWAIRAKGADVDRHNARAIKFLFSGLALVFIVAGFMRLLEPPPGQDVELYVAIAFLAGSFAVSVAAFLWVHLLQRYAYRHRDEYRRHTARTP